MTVRPDWLHKLFLQLERIRRPYAHFCFPSGVSVQAAVDTIDRAVTSTPGWTRVPEPTRSGEATGYRSWSNAGSGAELLMVVAGFDPLIVATGARYAVPSLALPRGCGQALGNVRRTVKGMRGEEIDDGDLLPLAQQAQERPRQ